MYLELRGEGEVEVCLICNNPLELTENGVMDHILNYDHPPLWETDNEEPEEDDLVFSVVQAPTKKSKLTH